MSVLRWIARNLSTLLLSIMLALIVWVSATITDDPNQEGLYPPIPIEVIGKSPDLLLTNQIPTKANLTLKAPKSIWDQLSANPSLVRAWIDLTGLTPGEYTLNVQSQVDLKPVRIITVDPQDIRVFLEPLVVEEFPITLNIIGEPPFGYRKGIPQVSPSNVSVSGPASAVERVKQVAANLDISGSSQTIRTVVPVQALDENGAPVLEVTLSSKEVNVVEPISILGGYKNVAVKVTTNGQVANGYRLTTISVTPPTITVYSSDPQLVNEIPGYVETLPVDLSGLTDDAEFNAELDLPSGISLVSEPGVVVQIGVAAIEGSLKLILPVEVLGLQPELSAQISPSTVDILIFGPLPILETLTPASFRAIVDLTGLQVGTYQIAPILDLKPEAVQVQAINPATVEVVISNAPTPTPTARVTPTPRTSLPTATPTP